MSDNVKQLRSRTRVLSTRVTPELYARVEQQALEADRPVAAEVRRIVRKALESQEASAA